MTAKAKTAKKAVKPRAKAAPKRKPVAKVKPDTKDEPWTFGPDSKEVWNSNQQPPPDTLADLVKRLNVVIDGLSADGTEVTLSVQRIPQPFWRYLKPVLKFSTKPGKPL